MAEAHSPGYEPQLPTKKVGLGTERRVVTLDEILDEWEQRREDDLARIFSGTVMRWATMMMIMMMISRIVVIRSALKHLIVAGIEIHKLTSLNVSYYFTNSNYGESA